MSGQSASRKHSEDQYTATKEHKETAAYYEGTTVKECKNDLNMWS